MSCVLQNLQLDAAANAAHQRLLQIRSTLQGQHSEQELLQLFMEVKALKSVIMQWMRAQKTTSQQTDTPQE